MAPLVTIIILNWNGKELLTNCLKSIKEITEYPNFEIIIVDNGSSDGSQEFIKEVFPDVNLIENKDNRGFAGGNNQGIRAANGGYFFLLNNDTIVLKGWLKSLIKLAESDPKIGIVGPNNILPEENSSIFLGGGGYIDDKGISRHIGICNEQEVDMVGGAAFLIKKNVVEKIGELDEGFNPIYFEETDYCFRAKKAGFKLFFTPSSKIVHFESVTTKEKTNKWRFITLNKNRTRFVLLHFSNKRLIKAFCWEVLRVIKSIILFRIHWLLEAYWINLKNLSEILEKRKRYAHGDLKVLNKDIY